MTLQLIDLLTLATDPKTEKDASKLPDGCYGVTISDDKRTVALIWGPSFDAVNKTIEARPNVDRFHHTGIIITLRTWAMGFAASEFMDVNDPAIQEAIACILAACFNIPELKERREQIESNLKLFDSVVEEKLAELKAKAILEAKAEGREPREGWGG